MLRKYRTGFRLPAGEGRALRKKGGKKVGAANLLASSDQDVDFFICVRIVQKVCDCRRVWKQVYSCEHHKNARI